ncbi:MAG: 3-dehydroquinate synthase [Bacteroidota bacterium]
MKTFAEFLRERSYSKIVVIVDELTKQHCLPILKKGLTAHFPSPGGAQERFAKWHLIEIPSGEVNKNLDTCELIWEQLMDLEVDRNGLVINLGGGVIGDMGGFCASTFKRGIHFVQVPTTLLSQVDASIGGKLGIDFARVKNSVGVFNDPQAVFIDPVFLQTLSDREIRSGFAEVIKHSLIADREQWEYIKTIESLESVDWAKILVPSLSIKKRVVEADPFEHGLRKSLNFGHTIGHGIEGVLLESASPLLHGEAIAIGMICESYLSGKVLGLDELSLNEIAQFILRIYGKEELYDSDFSQMISLMRKDKKNQDARINFTMLKQPGESLINQTSKEAAIVESMRYYNQLVTV